MLVCFASQVVARMKVEQEKLGFENLKCLIIEKTEVTAERDSGAGQQSMGRKCLTWCTGVGQLPPVKARTRERMEIRT